MVVNASAEVLTTANSFDVVAYRIKWNGAAPLKYSIICTDAAGAVGFPCFGCLYLSASSPGRAGKVT